MNLRRVQGAHDIRLDGLFDLAMRCQGLSVLDLGCNRGAISFELALNYGARLVHGIELSPPDVEVARAWFSDYHFLHQFEAGDLTQGPVSLAPFGTGNWDVVLMLGIYHKIKRAPSKPYAELGAQPMSGEELSDLVRHVGSRTTRYLGYRGYAHDIAQIDADLTAVGLRKIAQSEISELPPTAIWRRG